MKVLVIRTAMIGGGLSYDLLVPRVELPKGLEPTHFIIPAGTTEHFVDFVDATLPPEQRAMPKGWPRYTAFLAHEKEARRRMLDIAASVFPELERIRAKRDSLPTLWVCGLLQHETDGEAWVEVRA